VFKLESFIKAILFLPIFDYFIGIESTKINFLLIIIFVLITFFLADLVKFLLFLFFTRGRSK